MKLATLFKEIGRKHRYATTDDIRKVFGDYHNVLHWLAVFLLEDEELAEACIVDACTIAQTQTPVFHEWLVHWAARATVACALQIERACVTELAPEYEKSESVYLEHPLLSPEYFRLLIKNSEDIHARLDVLCRFVLVLHGLAKDACNEVAAQLGISQSAVERAYGAAYDTLDLVSNNCSATRTSRRVRLQMGAGSGSVVTMSPVE